MLCSCNRTRCSSALRQSATVPTSNPTETFFWKLAPRSCLILLLSLVFRLNVARSNTAKLLFWDFHVMSFTRRTELTVLSVFLSIAPYEAVLSCFRRI
jgi:hypothetical protein